MDAMQFVTFLIVAGVVLHITFSHMGVGLTLVRYTLKWEDTVYNILEE